MRRFFLSTVAATVVALSAHAEWTQSINEIDEFTGERLILWTAMGKNIEDDSDALLGFRVVDGDYDFIWNPGLPFICDGERPDIMIKFGDNPPEKAGVYVRDGNESILFTQPVYIADQLRRHGSMMARLSDHCGNYVTSRFSGDITEHVDYFDALKDSRWTMNNEGNLEIRQGDFLIILSSLFAGSSSDGTQEPTILVAYRDEMYIPSKYEERVEFEFGDSATGYGTVKKKQYYTLNEGHREIFVHDLSTQDFLDAITVDPRMWITVGGTKYEIDISGLSDDILKMIG